MAPVSVRFSSVSVSVRFSLVSVSVPNLQNRFKTDSDYGFEGSVLVSVLKVRFRFLGSCPILAVPTVWVWCSDGSSLAVPTVRVWRFRRFGFSSGPVFDGSDGSVPLPISVSSVPTVRFHYFFNFFPNNYYSSLKYYIY